MADQGENDNIEQDAELREPVPPLERQFTLSEAMYVFEGLAFKGSALEDLSGKITPSSIKKNLMTMDLRFDTLAEYLATFSDVVNQHATMLNDIKKDAEKKVYTDTLNKCLITNTKAFKIKDPDFNRQIVLQEGPHLSETCEDLIEESGNKVANKITKICTALDLLYSQNQELFHRMEAAEKKCVELEKSKASNSELRELDDRLIGLIMAKADEVQKLCFEKMESYYQKISTQVKEVYNKLSSWEIEGKKRLSDLEDEMKRRISQDYVDLRISKIEENFNLTLQGFNIHNESKIDNWKASTDESIKLIREELDLRLGRFESNFKEFEVVLQGKVELNIFEIFRKGYDRKNDDISLKFKEEEKRLDQIEKKLKDMSSTIKTKITEETSRLKDELKTMQKTVKDVVLKLESGEYGGGGGGASKELLNLLRAELQCDVHKPATESSGVMDRLKSLEEDMLKLKDMVHKMIPSLENVQEEIANKIDLSTFSNQLGKKVDREEFIDMYSKLTSDTDKTKKVENDLLKLRRKMNENIEALDRKLKKMKKEVDVNQIKKLIESKANISDVKLEVLRVEDNLGESQELISHLRKDFESMVSSFKKMAQYISHLQDDEAAGTLASTKAALCLSCGRGGPKFLPEKQQVFITLSLDNGR